MERTCLPSKANSLVSDQVDTNLHWVWLFCVRLLSFENCSYCFIVLASKSTVHFKNASDGHEIELDVRGDWFDRSANITFGGQPVAHISRSFFNVREIFADKETVSRVFTRLPYTPYIHAKAPIHTDSTSTLCTWHQMWIWQ